MDLDLECMYEFFYKVYPFVYILKNKPFLLQAWYCNHLLKRMIQKFSKIFKSHISLQFCNPCWDKPCLLFLFYKSHNLLSRYLLFHFFHIPLLPFTYNIKQKQMNYDAPKWLQTIFISKQNNMKNTSIWNKIRLLHYIENPLKNTKNEHNGVSRNSITYIN